MSKPRAIITPKGEYASATEAAQAFGLSAQGASWKARLQQSGWRYSNEHPLPPRPPRPRGRPRKAPPMYYAERFDRDGWLWTRTAPKGEWVKAPARKTVERLWEMLDKALQDKVEGERC